MKCQMLHCTRDAVLVIKTWTSSEFRCCAEHIKEFSRSQNIELKRSLQASDETLNENLEKKAKL